LLSETKREKGPSVSEVVFFKMMYKMKDLMKRTLDGEQRMTSIEIAEVTGKSHKNVMQSIRNMEPAWKKVNGLKFQLVDYKDKKGELRPCYSLTKTECLYVATKFNDEARAKLVLRWKQLEEERLKREMKPMTDLEIMCRATLILKKKVEQKENLIADLQPKADYCDEVLDSTDCLTMTQVAKGLGMTVHELTQRLLKERVIYEQSGQYMLYAPYARRHYARNRTHFHRDLFGNPHTHTYLVWTERGREFIHSLFC
jgi:phage regulator Rha-like protein